MPTRISLLLALTLSLLAAPVVGQWMTPALVPSVNSAYSASNPTVSPNGLTLYFSSQRPGGTGRSDLYCAKRSITYTAFASPVESRELNSPKDEYAATLRADGLEVLITSDRLPSPGGINIWRATRPNLITTFSTPQIVAELNSTRVDGWPTMTRDGLLLYFISERAGPPEIWMATRNNVNSTFSKPVQVRELNTNTATIAEQTVSISADGLTISWTSNRPGGLGSWNIWMASRLSRLQPFSNIVNLQTVNSNAFEQLGGCSPLGDELFFASARKGGPAVVNIWSSRFIGLTSDGIAGIGKTQTLNFSDPTSVGLPYIAAASFGRQPGIKVGTRTIPLNPDPLFTLSFGGIPFVLRKYSGVIGSRGVARGSITVPNNAALIGVKFFNAFVVLDPKSPHGIKTISNAHEVLLQ